MYVHVDTQDSGIKNNRIYIRGSGVGVGSGGGLEILTNDDPRQGWVSVRYFL